MFSHRILIGFSGVLWLALGIFLLSKGLNFLVLSSEIPGFSGKLFSLSSSIAETKEQAAIFLITTAIFVGFLKGRLVLKKAAERVVDRIESLPNPSPFYRMYAPRYYLVIALMISLGVFMNVFAIPLDIRGWIDVAVGSALIQGAIFYFRLLLNSPLRS